MTLKDLHCLAAANFNFDADKEYKLSLALLRLFSPRQTLGGNREKPRTRTLIGSRCLSLLAPRRRSFAIARYGEGATS